MDWYPYVVYVDKSGPDWAVISISFGALVVAALALVLNYKLRKVPFQQALHVKQIDTFLEIMKKLDVFQNAFFQLIRSAPDAAKQRNFESLRQETGQLITQLLYILETSTVVLPSALAESLGNYARVVIDLHGSEEGFAERLSAFRAPDDTSLVAAYRNVTQTARKQLGIEPLTEDMLRLMEAARGKQVSMRRED